MATARSKRNWFYVTEADIDALYHLFNFTPEEMKLRIDACFSFANQNVKTIMREEGENYYFEFDVENRGLINISNTFKSHFDMLFESNSHNPFSSIDHNPTIGKERLKRLAIRIEIASIFQLYKSRSLSSLNKITMRRFLQKGNNELLTIAFNEYLPNIRRSLNDDDLETKQMILKDITIIARKAYEDKIANQPRLPYLDIKVLREIIRLIGDKHEYLGFHICIYPRMEGLLRGDLAALEKLNLKDASAEELYFEEYINYKQGKVAPDHSLPTLQTNARKRMRTELDQSTLSPALPTEIQQSLPSQPLFFHAAPTQTFWSPSSTSSYIPQQTPPLQQNLRLQTVDNNDDEDELIRNVEILIASARDIHQKLLQLQAKDTTKIHPAIYNALCSAYEEVIKQLKETYLTAISLNLFAVQNLIEKDHKIHGKDSVWISPFLPK